MNAGQGRKSSANFPPVAVRCDLNGYCVLDQAGSTTGAGIATFDFPQALAEEQFLLAVRAERALRGQAYTDDFLGAYAGGTVNAPGAGNERTLGAPRLVNNAATLPISAALFPDGVGSVLKANPSFNNAGNVDLIAPVGTVDAGDAGVRVSGNLSVAARFVLNADNFDVKGKTVGVPTLPVTDTGALTNAGNTAAAATKEAGPPARATGRDSIIIVEIIGFGGGDATPDAPRSDCPGGALKAGVECNTNLRRQNGASLSKQNGGIPLKVVGLGTLTEAERQELTEEERRFLVQ